MAEGPDSSAQGQQVPAVELTDHLTAIVESSDDAILSKTLDGVILTWNTAAERLYGYTAEEIVGKSVSLLVPADRPGEVEEILAKARRGEPVDHFESWRVRKDGTLVPVSLTTSVVRDTAGRVIAVATIARDNTERDRQRAVEAAGEQALEATRLKSEFLATMSHEIRTPMNGVIGMAGLLLDTDLDPEQREYAESVRTSGQALLTIINDILDFSKIEAGHLELEEIDFDLAAVVEEVAELLAGAARDKGLELVTAIDPGIPTEVRGDPGRVRQVLVNLVGNAVKFTAAGQVVVTLTVTTTAAPGPADRGAMAATFEVRDTGIGIPPHVLARLFDAFTQADASTGRRYGGTGLGLSISHRLVELMGGTMAVDSAPGAGSTFSFTVPLRPGHGGVNQPDRLIGIRALIVDDVVASRTVLVAQLAAWGMTTTAAGNAAGALGAIIRADAAGAPFDVILADYRMPGHDNVDLADALTAVGAELSQRPPVIILSSVARGDDARRRDTGNAAHLLVKPARRSQLFDAIVTAIGAAPLRPDITGRVEDSPVRAAPGTRILVADDNALNQRLAILILEKAGYRVDAVADGTEVLEALTRGRYDAVLMDCQMPVMDGYAAAAEIRRREAGAAHIPIIAVTASAMLGDAERALAAGMDDHVTKPIDRRDLHLALTRVLGTTGPSGAGHPPRGDAAVDGFDQRALDQLLALDGTGEALRSLARLFIRDTPATAAAFVDAAARRDAAGVGAAAHSLSGTAATFGEVALSQLAARIEHEADAGHVPDPEAVALVGAALGVTMARLGDVASGR